MRIFKPIKSDHGDFIHDVCFDYYGQRLASCSSDRKIKIFSSDDTGEWALNSEWTAHQGSVWKLSWAHPEFGQILASCSFDRTVSIWEEHAVTEPWRNQAQLADSRESVHDVEFSPRHLGLRLATASADGFVRIYEAIDVLNLSHWPLQEEFLADKDGATCLSWNMSPFDVPMIAVGSSNATAKVWAYNTSYNRWQICTELTGHLDGIHDIAWAPNMGRSYHLIATASKDETIKIWKLTREAAHSNNSNDKNQSQGVAEYRLEQLASHAEHQTPVWRVEWNVTGTMLASSGDDGTVRMWKNDYEGQWVCVSTVCGGNSPSSDTNPP